MKQKNNKISNFISVLLALLPIMGQYGFFSDKLSFGDVFIIILLLYILFFGIPRKKLEISDKGFLVFTIWLIVSSIFSNLIINNIFTSSSVSAFLKIITYSLLILIVPKYLNKEKVTNVYFNIIVTCSIIIFIQFILYNVFNVMTSLVINSKYFPALFVNDDYFTTGYSNLLFNNGIYRPASFFSEPALFAQYAVPGVLLKLFSSNNKSKYLPALFVSIAILLGHSANGTIYVMVIWLIVLLDAILIKLKNKQFSIKSKTGFVLLIIIVLSPFIIPKLYSLIAGKNDLSLINRLTEITASSGQTSGSMRVLRGWQIYNGLGFFEKVIGIGVGNIIQYLDMHQGIVFMFSKSYNGYMSGLPSIFVFTGFIGGLLFIGWLFKYLISKNVTSKSLAIFLLLYLIASSSFYTLIFVVTLILIINYGNVKYMNVPNDNEVKK